jgi:hypothetical protein
MFTEASFPRATLYSALSKGLKNIRKKKKNTIFNLVKNKELLNKKSYISNFIFSKKKNIISL